MALYVFQGRRGAAAEPKYRAELMNSSRADSPLYQTGGSVVQKLLLQCGKIISVLLELSKAVLGRARTNR